MFNTFAVIQVIVSLLLIIVILLQEGKKGMGSVFGGSSGSVFGARGAGNLLTKVTSVLAFLFMLNSVWLAHLSSDSGSVVQSTDSVGVQVEEAEKKEVKKEEKKEPVTETVPVVPTPQKVVEPVEKKAVPVEKEAAPTKAPEADKK